MEHSLQKVRNAAFDIGLQGQAAGGFGAPTNLLDLAEPAGQGVWEGSVAP
jgi:hypothetical protein